MANKNDIKPVAQKQVHRLPFHELLCQETLSQNSRRTTCAPVESREELKALLSMDHAEQRTKSSNEQKNKIEKNSSFEHCLEILTEDFCKKKAEILKLNKARKEAIESAIQSHLPENHGYSIDNLLKMKMGSLENNAFLNFANETALFHLFQILLLKRWADLKLSSAEVLQSNTQTLNWKITSFLKKHHPKKLLQRNEWLFLKLNIYSWYSPSAEAWERIRLHLVSLNLADESQDFLLGILLHLTSSNRVPSLNNAPPSTLTNFSWKLLLSLQHKDSVQGVCSMSPVLVSGLNYGHTLISYQNQSERKNLQSIHGFTANDLEHYLTEIMILWMNPIELSHPQLFPQQILNKSQNQYSQDFTQTLSTLLLNSCSLAFYADHQSNRGNSYNHALNCLSLLEENGLFLFCSDHFWTTEESTEATYFRENILKQARLRYIFDLRQLNILNTSKSKNSVQKGIFIFEKCSTKEFRDASRPTYVRIKGQINHANDLNIIASNLIEPKFQDPIAPGEILSLHGSQCALPAIKAEIMAAATTQSQLKASPWTSLTENSYYEISNDLKKTTQRIFSCGNILKTKTLDRDSNSILGFKRAIPIQEIVGKALVTDSNDTKSAQYIFIPDKSVQESNHYFTAMINSSPIQFWYRQEREVDHTKKTKSQLRQTEQLLKLMPVARILTDSVFDVNSIQNFGKVNSLEQAEVIADRILIKNKIGLYVIALNFILLLRC